MTSANGIERRTDTGQWLLSVESRHDTLDEQIGQLFRGLTRDQSTWMDLSKRFDGNLLVGLFMGDVNNVVTLGRDELGLLAARGLKLQLDIYGPVSD